MFAAVREALGKFNIIPSIDFDEDTSVEIPVLRPGTNFTPPHVEIDPFYNPFTPFNPPLSKPKPFGGKPFDSGFESAFLPDESSDFLNGAHNNYFSGPVSNPYKPLEETVENLLWQSEPRNEHTPLVKNNWIQLKNRYILTPVKSGLMLIDQKRAHERILYEQILRKFAHSEAEIPSRKLLYPVALDLLPDEVILFQDICDDLCKLGFEVRTIGKSSVLIEALPADGSQDDPETLFRSLLSECKSIGNLSTDRIETLAKTVAKAGAVAYGKILHPEEIRSLVDHLFACAAPGISPTGKTVVTMLRMEEIDNKF